MSLRALLRPWCALVGHRFDIETRWWQWKHNFSSEDFLLCTRCGHEEKFSDGAVGNLTGELPIYSHWTARKVTMTREEFDSDPCFRKEPRP